MTLKIRDITKSFGDIAVLKGISFELEEGQLLGLVGENGAGKSTLMNVLAGVFSPTSGEMWVNQAVYDPHSPNEAFKRGIAFIHQELNLFPNLTISENLFINDFPTRKILGIDWISREKAFSKTTQLLSRIGLEEAPDKKVGELSTAQRQMVEIAKALSIDPKVIIFDEPTTSLTRHETEQLFQLINDLKADGISMIYISHNLDDVLRLSDRVAVLRDGVLIGNEIRSRYTKAMMIDQMVGRSMDQYFPSRVIEPTEQQCLAVENLSTDLVRQVSFSIRKREVVGFYGLVGAGRSELARAIYGLDSMIEGRITYDGRDITSPRPDHWIKEGVGFLTEDRREEGLMLDDTLGNNTRLAALPNYQNKGILDKTHLLSLILEKIKESKVKFTDLYQHASTLSGGNQQKIVLAKWLLIQPKLLILDEPTKGIDISAKHEIYTLINQLITSGSSIMMISSEIEELLGMCDRINVMSQGSIVDTFERSDFDRSRILAAALHSDVQKEFTR